jgi:type IV pilus assembly protein PilF
MMLWRFLACVLVSMAASCSQPVRNDDNSSSQRVTATDRARIHTELGSAYYGNNQLSVALEEFREALQADSNYVPAHYQIGLVYMALNEDKLAEQSFERALKLDPADSNANNSYGLFLCQRKQDKSAFRYFDAALKNPLYATPEEAYANAGTCAWLQGDDAKAEDWLRKALALQPNQPRALYYLAEVTFKKGDMRNARALLTRHMRLVQPSAEALWLGARIEGRLGDQTALASYGVQLNNRYPNAPQTRAFNEGKHK